MNLTDQQIQDFIDAWKADFDEALSPEVARSEAERLLDFFAQFGEGLAAIRQKKVEISNSGDIKTAWRKTVRRNHR